jgi:hypothetical protein
MRFLRSLAGETSSDGQLDPAPRSTARVNTRRIPIVINSFNQLTYLRLMVEQLQRLGRKDIVVLDQASSFPALLEYLDEIARTVTVVRLRENNGPHWLFTSGFSSLLPRYFVYTDPDILFPASMPRSFIADMVRAARLTGAAKIGLALDVSRPENIKRAVLHLRGRDFSIPEWEQQFWDQPIRLKGLELYRAPVDTTFALYDRERFDPEIKEFRGEQVYYCMDMPHSYRLGGRYTSVHMPWMLDDPIPQEELDWYIATRRNVHEYLGRSV